jgi:hypothetical protein
VRIDPANLHAESHVHIASTLARQLAEMGKRMPQPLMDRVGPFCPDEITGLAVLLDRGEAMQLPQEGRGRGLKIRTVSVRVRLGAREEAWSMRFRA